MREHTRPVVMLGAGKMAEAMVAGWLASGAVDARRIRVTNRSNDQRLEHFRSRYGVLATRDRRALLEGAGVVVVAVKPADVPAALAAVRPHLPADATVISVAAGVRTDALRELLGGTGAVLRAMPNTSCRVRQSAIALCAAEGCPPEAVATAEALLGLLGTTFHLPEEAFDAVTALAGSGPAYAYLLAEAMLEAARDLGLADDVARELIALTLVGAGLMLRATALSPAELRAQVTSPNGTTAAAMRVLIEERDVPGAIRRAVQRAAERAAELAALADPRARAAEAAG